VTRHSYMLLDMANSAVRQTFVRATTLRKFVSIICFASCSINTHLDGSDCTGFRDHMWCMRTAPSASEVQHSTTLCNAAEAALEGGVPLPGPEGREAWITQDQGKTNRWVISAPTDGLQNS
jgi:hypothetical protein